MKDPEFIPGPASTDRTALESAQRFVNAATTQCPWSHDVSVDAAGDLWLIDEDSNVSINISAGLRAAQMETA